MQHAGSQQGELSGWQQEKFLYRTQRTITVLPFCVSTREHQNLSVEIHKSDSLHLSLATPDWKFSSTDMAQFRRSESRQRADPAKSWVFPQN